MTQYQFKIISRSLINRSKWSRGQKYFNRINESADGILVEFISFGKDITMRHRVKCEELSPLDMYQLFTEDWMQPIMREKLGEKLIEIFIKKSEEYVETPSTPAKIGCIFLGISYMYFLFTFCRYWIGPESISIGALTTSLHLAASKMLKSGIEKRARLMNDYAKSLIADLDLDNTKILKLTEFIRANEMPRLLKPHND